MTADDTQQLKIRGDLEKIVRELERVIPLARAAELNSLAQRLEEARKVAANELSSISVLPSRN